MTPEPVGAHDTAARSLAHWSEGGRREMEQFYALARRDYVELAAAFDWPRLLSGAETLLDVACGSGKFPEAVVRDCDLSALGRDRIDYDLLDPSAFSLAEAARALHQPFRRHASFETTLEDLDPAAGPWDVVWATHALYALEPTRLATAAQRFAHAIGPGGFGFIAQGAREGHYMRMYDAFLESPGGEGRTPYTAVEAITAALREAGAQVQVTRISYEHVVDAEDVGTLEGYLHRCLFDDSLTLQRMLELPVLGTYLAGRRDLASGTWRFGQEVDCLLIEALPADR